MRKNLVKKVTSIVVVALVCALVLVTIVLALVPKRLENVINKGYIGITVYNGDEDNTFWYTDPTSGSGLTSTDIETNKIFKKVESLHEDSLKDSLLSAIFQGVGSFDIRVEATYYSNALTQAQEESDKVLKFTYSEDDKQTLKIGGKDYKYNKSLSGEYVTFVGIIMPVGNKDSFEERTLYLISEGTKSSYQVKYLAHHGDLADYIDTLDFSAQK